ncbi:class I SAM-dependent methyltransferase [Desulfohalovibrio reitneri]|uniref:class I SAM-dependent methyltransferase n=1 Tax=Desulfohalovibrio reitneri TaxID=1307759 RepID=UPI00068DC8F8|nr:class I SAM-dependent methyltransferase [Desulfohalovibrio reitneri]
MKQDEELATQRELYMRADFHGARVLEVGCGNGRVTAMYADDTATTVGLEPDHAAALQAVRHVPKSRFAQASGENLPVLSGGFDIVLFTLSLHHHPGPERALKEAARVTAPGGRILALEPAPEGEVQRLCNIFSNEDSELQNTQRALEACGLSVLSSGLFSTEWVFRDFHEVVEYAFSYYDHPQDEAKLSEMRRFLESKVNDAPLRLTDTLRLTSLAV